MVGAMKIKMREWIFNMTSQDENLTASELLNQMRKAGFVVTLNCNKVNVKESRWIDDELADLITRHKTDLIKILESEET